jgi:hypothetical protein
MILGRLRFLKLFSRKINTRIKSVRYNRVIGDMRGSNFGGDHFAATENVGQYPIDPL